jgi:putative ABC transport system permease protein
MKFLSLFNQMIVRDLIRNPVRTLLTLTGVALGIAVVVAVQLANDRAIDSFTDSLQLLNGQADLQVAANGRPLDENLIGELSWAWDVGAMTAILEGRLQLADPEVETPFGQESVRLFGVDLLSDAPFRTYERDAASGGGNLDLGITRDQFMDLLVDPNAIILPRALANEWDVDVGDSVDLLVANRELRFTVHTVLNDAGIARAFDGQIVFMDIAAAQLAMNRFGEIDRIELVLDDPGAVDTVADRIRQQLPDSVIVYQPDDTRDEAARMTRAFRYNLTALSYIALVVGMILIYNTLNIAVVRRRGEIGALRTLGTSRRTIGWMFLTEAVVFGIVGAMAGIWIGEFLARAAGALVSRTIAMLYTGVTGEAGTGGPDPYLYIQMILLGGALAAVSGTGPALRATRISPIETMRKGATGFPKSGVWTLAGILALVPAVILSFAPPLGGFPFLGYGAGVLFIAASALLTPMFVRVLLRESGWILTRFLPTEGRLAIDTIRGSLSRVVVAVVSLSIAVAMLASVAIMVASFRDTVVVWVDQTLQGDLYMRPAASGGDGGRNAMSPEALRALDGVAGIAAIDRYRAVAIDYDGFPAFMAAGEFEILSTYSRLLFMDGQDTAAVASQLIGQNRVVVSEPFAVRHGVGVDDTIALPTPDGFAPFEIAAVFYDYSNEGGLVVMDRSTYLGRFDDPAISNVAVYLEPGADPDTVRTRIADRLDGAGARIATNGELRGQVMRVFDQTFEVTYALEVIALAVAVLGVANTLAALILERRTELAMLRFIGASRSQIRRVIMLESGLVGVMGGVIGLALGGVLSLLLIYVINFQSFGWTIQFTLPVGFLAQSFVAVLLATIAAGLYPAALALKLDPIEGIRAE